MAFALIACYLDWARFGYRARAADYTSIWVFPYPPRSRALDTDAAAQADALRRRRYDVLALECGDAMGQGRR